MPDLLGTYRKLYDHYGPCHWWPAESPFEMSVGAILTQNTNWRNVERAIINLRSADALDAISLSALPRNRLEDLIRPAGFFRQKAARLQDFCAYLGRHYQSRLEQMLAKPLAAAREELLALKGIGPETADSILLYAGEHPSFVVDAYTGRLFQRLGLLHGTETYAEIRDLFMHSLPQEASLYNEYHALIVVHAKEHCRKQPRCAGCPLAADCRYLLDRNPALS